jgi:hypothetical protein
MVQAASSFYVPDGSGTVTPPETGIARAEHDAGGAKAPASEGLGRMIESMNALGYAD